MTSAAVASAGELRRRLAARLAKAFAQTGREGTASLDARLLVAHALGMDPERLVLDDVVEVDVAAEAQASALVERRIAGEPVARILGRSAFFGLEFDIGPDTLVPRPDTETVVEATLAFVDRTAHRGRPLSILDLGTGSGVILLSLLSELPKATGVAVDISPGALRVSLRNVSRLGLSERVRLVRGDWGSSLAGGFDIIVSNPPYIKTGTIADLQVEVAAHDPHMALDGGRDGLGAYRKIFTDLDRLLASGGRGFFEIGFDQAPDVAEVAKSRGFRATFHRDLAGIERVAELLRSSDDDVVSSTALASEK